jgi:membrane-bound lytic murein transglycosylase F
LEDARKLTKRRKGNPNKWQDVKKTLPLLAQAEWHSQTKYGYARGYEPVQYVENIRSYYTMLQWLGEDNPMKKNEMLTQNDRSGELAYLEPLMP